MEKEILNNINNNAIGLIPEDISKRIISLRFLLAMFVVMIHNYFTKQSVIDAALNGQELIFNQTGFTYWFMNIAAGGIILKCSKLISQNKKLFLLTKQLSSFSFFLYAIHFLIMICICPLWLKIFPMKNDLFIMFEYFGLTALIIFLGLSIGLVLRKIFPSVYSLVNGGRK